MSRDKPIFGLITAPSGARIGVVAARFNASIVDKLVEGALEALRKIGLSDEQIMLVRVPGAWEIPVICRHLIESERVDGVVALGCVIRGDTVHFEHVAGEAAEGTAWVQRTTGKPIANAILACENMQQALDRCGGKLGNKGEEAALAAVEMIQIIRSIHGSSTA